MQTLRSDIHRAEKAYPDFDSGESFASALDKIADLREFEDFEPESEDVEHPLYLKTLYGMEQNPIPCRVIRSELVHVASDAEYLAKLHCIRLAFHHMFRDMQTSKWVADTGRQILTDLLCLGELENVFKTFDMKLLIKPSCR